MNEEKSCPVCKVSKPISEFGKNRTRKDGLCYRCCTCQKNYWKDYYAKHHNTYKKRAAKWRSDNPDRVKEMGLKCSYSMTLEDYQSLLDKQNGVCAICSQAETRQRQGKVYRLHVDHCHRTGKVRGLLCHSCNSALGLFKENLQTLENAKNYLASSDGN